MSYFKTGCFFRKKIAIFGGVGGRAVVTGVLFRGYSNCENNRVCMVVMKNKRHLYCLYYVS